MAIDTDSKKLSLISFAQPYMPPLPFPDNSILSAEDKQQLLWTYTGVLFSEEGALYIVWLEAAYNNKLTLLSEANNEIYNSCSIGLINSSEGGVD